MELSLRWSFELSRSLEGYTVGFRAMTMEALGHGLTTKSRDSTCSDM
jgi:hypothetical protein